MSVTSRGELKTVTRVLVVEDSETTRALLTSILAQDREIELVGEARNGAEAITTARELRPDVITMDINMPVVDGFAATEQIMSACPIPIVLVSAFSNVTQAEAAARALSCGAVAVLRTPPGIAAAGHEESARELIATVKAMAGVKLVRHFAKTPRSMIDLSAQSRRRPRLVAIAASTGGPAALRTILPALTADFPVPILIVQHITSGFVQGLATWLSTILALRVKVAQNGEPFLAPGTIYFAPDDYHLGVAADFCVILSSAPPLGGFRPSANFLFETAAQAAGAEALGAILTGMGDDGVEGLREFKRRNGYLIAQDEQSSVVFGMPGAAIAAGLADAVLPLDAIGQNLKQMADAVIPADGDWRRS